MAYLLIFDMRGNGSGRRRVNRYLKRYARIVQKSVWEFRDMRALMHAAELVRAAGGAVMAFVKSDRILFDAADVMRHVDVVNKTSAVASVVDKTVDCGHVVNKTSRNQATV